MWWVCLRVNTDYRRWVSDLRIDGTVMQPGRNLFCARALTA